jgi:hypothetical protein
LPDFGSKDESQTLGVGKEATSSFAEFSNVKEPSEFSTTETFLVFKGKTREAKTSAEGFTFKTKNCSKPEGVASITKSTPGKTSE